MMIAVVDAGKSTEEGEHRMQRYVSSELTHFVGRSELSDEARYSVLHTIVSSGKLLASPRGGSGNAGRGWFRSSNRPLSSNERYTTGIVCFCDIPLEGLQIHMSKYGRFGLTWEKSYLVARGANPVFYIAKDSPSASQPPVERSRYFDAMVGLWERFLKEKFHDPLFGPTKPLASAEGSTRTLSDAEAKDALGMFREMRAFFDLAAFVEHHILCFTKFFDSNLPDDHPDNFYMEREWRIIGDVSFEFGSLRRVILPTSFEERFRQEFPGYVGQIYSCD